jgi:hypothetical protein
MSFRVVPAGVAWLVLAAALAGCSSDGMSACSGGMGSSHAGAGSLAASAVTIGALAATCR